MDAIRLQAWEAALPWMAPRELAALASACSPLARLVASFTRRCLSDISRGLEPRPIPVLGSRFYPSFDYSPLSCLPANPSLHGHGCPCTPTCSLASEGGSSSSGCACGRQSRGASGYDRSSRLLFLTGADKPNPASSTPLVLECGPACSCGPTCMYRLSQRGVGVKLFIARDRVKGWCLHAAQPIAKACFVCEYAGELITTSEARKRQKVYDSKAPGTVDSCSALLVLREHLPSGQICLRLNIDSTKVGNVARFINHSCDGGNLLPCIIRLAGSLIPKLAFFARRDICEEEELTFSYGNVDEGSRSRPCFCATAVCKGVLPSEKT